MKTYILKTNLLDRKSVIRALEIPENATLYELAESIVQSYGFNFDHAFGFFEKIGKESYLDSKRKYELFADMDPDEIEPTGAKSVKKTKVSQVWKRLGDKMLLLFDYGECWQFVVELKELGNYVSNKKYPYTIGKTGKAPEQY